MKTTYFCAYHAKQIRCCEQTAMRSWNLMMHKGEHAYLDCRKDAAKIYLGSAVEIALLRFTCDGNRYFDDANVSRPLAFLVETHISETTFNELIVFLARVSSVLHEESKRSRAWLTEKIMEYYERIEISEKKFLMGESMRGGVNITQGLLGKTH